jgi:NLR family CARD domain-containing protein 3
MARDLFDQIDENKDGNISLEELSASVQRYCQDQGKPLQMALAGALEQLLGRHAGISFETFRGAVKDLPRVKAERVHFAQALGMHELVAGALPKGTFFDGLEGLRRLAEKPDSEIEAFAREQVARLTAELEGLLCGGIRKLRNLSATSGSALEQNSKFSMDSDALKGAFSSLQHFYDGPEKLIGNPNPKAAEGIRREHCERKNADKAHTTPNYNVTTTPRVEYYFVVDPETYKLTAGFPGYPHTPRDKSQWSAAGKGVWRGDHGRNVLMLGLFTQHATAVNAGLQEPEVVAVRLYTGPMYLWYNAALRGFPADLHAKLEGNRYETTVFCIISGIIKLSKLTEVPVDRRLYRGFGGMVLPDAFWGSKDGFRGVVETCFMSTTTDRREAMQYSGKDGMRSTVFEILAGRVDIGADLSWVSQYPSTREVSLPSSNYTCICMC